MHGFVLAKKKKTKKEFINVVIIPRNAHPIQCGSLAC